MKWPLQAKPESRFEVPLYNLYYLHAPGVTQPDPTMLWGTDVEVDELESYLRDRNQQSAILLRPVHVLLQATSRALVRYPKFNCRVIGRRVYAYRDINLRLAFRDQRQDDVKVVLLRRVNELALAEIAQLVWSQAIELATGRWCGDRDARRLKRLPSSVFHWLWRAYLWLDNRFRLPTIGRLDELRSGAVLVNDLSFYNAPPLRCYKPSRFPDASSAVSVMLGPGEHKVVVRHGALVVAKVAPLIIRADHRLVDTYQLGQFVATVRESLHHPAEMEYSLGEVPRLRDARVPAVADIPLEQGASEAA